MTSVAQFVILATTLGLVSLLGKLLGPIALGEYLLVRRVGGAFTPPTQLGLGIALPRYVARSSVKSTGEGETYFLASMLCLLTAVIGLDAVLYIERARFAELLFGHPQMTGHVIALCLLLLGWSTQIGVYGYYRGRLQMAHANFMQVFAMAFAPLVVILSLYRSHSVAFLLAAIGVVVFLGSIALAIPIAFRALRSGAKKLLKHCAELLQYGVVRVPGTIAMSLFFALGPIIAAHFMPLNKVSYFLIGMSILSAVGTCVSPLGIVILSKATMMLAQNRQAEICKNLGYLVSAVTEVSLFVCLQLIVFADVLIRVWVGDKFLEGTLVVRILMLGIPFYLFIISLRSVIDAMTWKPYNTGNVLLALVIFLVAIFASTRLFSGMLLLEAMAGALVLSLAFFAYLTGRVVERLYDFRLRWRQSLVPVGLSMLLGGAAVLFRILWGPGLGLVPVILLETFFALFFVGVLTKRGSPWLIRFWNTALINRSLVKV